MDARLQQSPDTRTRLRRAIGDALAPTLRELVERYLADAVAELEWHESAARKPIAMTPVMLEAGITEGQLRRAWDARIRDARQQVERERRRLAAIVRSAERRARTRSERRCATPRRVSIRAARPIAVRSRAAEACGAGDDDPDPEEAPGDRRAAKDGAP